MTDSLKDKLIKSLIDSKILTHEKLNRALEIQRTKGGKLSDILVAENYISKEELAAIIGRGLGIPPIKLSRYKIEPEVLALIPKKLVRQYRIMPISKIGDMITLAMVDPLNVFAIDDIKSLTGYKIRALITTDKDIDDAISEYHEASTGDAIEELIEGLKVEGDIGIVSEDEESVTDSTELIRLVQEAPVVKITNMLLSEAVKLNASDILIEPQEKTLRVRYRVDGVLREGRTPPKQLEQAIVSRLKVMAGLNIAERRLPQDGRFMAVLLNKEIDFRLSILPGNMGEKAALRILDRSTAMLDLDKLGFEKQPLEVLKKAAKRPHGMILVCGPTGCGKTTTLYSILNFVDTPEKNIITVEDPVEYEIRGINQVSIRPAINFTFAKALRSILRQDPDIIMVGEIRDNETVDIAIKAALTGHLVLSTLHTTTASGSIVRLLNMGVEPFLISAAIIVIAAQRLVRRICPECKEPYKADKHTASRIGIEPNTTLYKGKGCKKCLNTGYKGRVGLIEALPITPRMRELIVSGGKEFQVKEAARKDGMSTLRENGIAKALAGITTVEEVIRVTVGDQDIAA